MCSTVWERIQSYLRDKLTDTRRADISYPANYVCKKTIPYNLSLVASVGTSFHKIMEEFYSLEPEERDESHLELLRDEVIKENGEKAERPLIQEDLDGYFAAKDYLTGAPTDHKALICDTEKFFKCI